MKLKKLILSIVLLPSFIFSQINNETYTKAMNFYHQGDYSSAYYLFKQIDENKDADKNNYGTSGYFAAECLIALDQIDGAAAQLESFIEEHPVSNFADKALFKLGTIYFQVGRYEDSRNVLTRLLENHPESNFVPKTFYWIGESFVRDNLLSEAESFLLQSIAKNNQSKFIDYSLYTLGTVYEKKGDYEKAVKYYDELLAYHNNSKLAPRTQLRIGLCFYKLKEYDRTVLELSDKLINKLTPDLIQEAKFVLANAFFKLKEYENAEKSYKSILDNLSNESSKDQINYSLAWVNFQTQEYEEAYRIFNRLAKEAGDTIRTASLFWSGEAKRFNGDKNSALKIYDRFLTLYPNNKYASQAKLNMALIYYNDNNFDKARTFLSGLSSSNDVVAFGKSLTLLGEISLNSKEYGVAEKYFESALNVDNLPKDLIRRAKLGLAVSLFFINDHINSEEILSELSEEDSRFEKDKVQFYLAECSFLRKNYNKALSHYNKISFSDQTITRQTLYGKAYSYFNLKDFANASYYFNEYIQRYRNDKNIVDCKLRLADSYFGIKDYEKSSAMFKNIFRRNRREANNSYTYYQYAQALFRNGEGEAATEQFKLLQEKFPGSKYSDMAQYFCGWIKFQQPDYKAAINEYEEIFEKYSDSKLTPLAIYSIGDSYYNMGSYDTAVVYYSKLLDEYPGTQYAFDAINGISFCYMAQDKTAEAVNVIDNYINLNNNKDFADKILMKRGEIFYGLSAYDKARDTYMNFINKYPNSKLLPDAFFWLGKSLVTLEQKEEAIKSFKVVTDSYLNKEVGLPAVIELGKIYNADQNYDLAIQLYSNVQDKFDNPEKNAEVLYEKALSHVKKGEVATAYDIFNDLSSYYIESVFADKAKLELGLIELARKNYERSEELLKTLGEIRNDDIGAKAQFNYGAVLFEQGKYDDAISALVRVRSVFPGYDEWYTRSLLKLGDCYIKIKEWKKAREMFRAVKKKHPKDEFGKEANKKLKTL
ncbi:MAG: tetratricopeptide repeat protein [Rhodothermaceae bacterium]